ncbi:hypothetical protein FIBSPDRAFT_1044128 [Athelia psychrophila]|uniref:Uncharacterized protein n=1 Tax=Athelia psychrophila TaxID=1759441 RepID=A0A166K7A9_9AGAM|nr:hypothetical protein FIBSPDRAFT_1044128 [Fibularhizoctonia sp. CBS 109695]
MSHRSHTIHDLTSLALHPSGVRVQGRHTNAIRDARGNLIARDAGGWGGVPKRARGALPAGGEEPAAEISIRKAMAEEEEEEEAEEGCQEEEEDGKDYGVTDYRARKRRKTIHDFDFLAPPVPDASVPSSDLLKQIHHFAASWYSSHDLLHDGSREYRRGRKAKKDAKTAKAAEEAAAAEARASGSKSVSASPKPESQPDEEEDEESDDEEGEDDEGEESDNVKGKGKAKGKSKAKGKAKSKKQSTARLDMYKTLDGSALLAIGMLLQHRTASLLLPTLADPDSWEAEMRREQEGGDVKGKGGKSGKRKGKWRGPQALVAKEEDE